MIDNKYKFVICILLVVSAVDWRRALHLKTEKGNRMTVCWPGVRWNSQNGIEVRIVRILIILQICS
jgi:hypothetical protein